MSLTWDQRRIRRALLNNNPIDVLYIYMYIYHIKVSHVRPKGNSARFNNLSLYIRRECLTTWKDDGSDQTTGEILKRPPHSSLLLLINLPPPFLLLLLLLLSLSLSLHRWKSQTSVPQKKTSVPKKTFLLHKSTKEDFWEPGAVAKYTIITSEKKVLSFCAVLRQRTRDQEYYNDIIII